MAQTIQASRSKVSVVLSARSDDEALEFESSLGEPVQVVDGFVVISSITKDGELKTIAFNRDKVDAYVVLRLPAESP